MSRRSDTKGNFTLVAGLATAISIVIGCGSLPVELQEPLRIEVLSSGDIPIGFEVVVDQDGRIKFEIGKRSYGSRLTAAEASELSRILETIGPSLPRGNLEVGSPHDARMQIVLGYEAAAYVEGGVPEEIRSLLRVLRQALKGVVPLRLRRSLIALDELIAP